MPLLKVLFADDQILEDRHWGLTEKEMISFLKSEHPTWPDSFVNGFPPMRLAVQKLQSAGYDVTLARKYQETITLVKNTIFDIAIVDLRWDGDESLNARESDAAGWKICAAIEEADKKLKRRTMQLVYSSRFNEDSRIASKAAEGNKMPIYKSYNEAGSESLLAAVGFFDKLIYQEKPTEEQYLATKLQDIMIQYLETPLKQQQRFFWLILFFLSLSLAILIIGGGIAIWDREKQLVGILSSVAGLLITTVSGFLLRWLNKREKDLNRTLNELKNQLNNAIIRAKQASQP
jgi:hypothetical protein